MSEWVDTGHWTGTDNGEGGEFGSEEGREGLLFLKLEFERGVNN